MKYFNEAPTPCKHDFYFVELKNPDFIEKYVVAFKCVNCDTFKLLTRSSQVVWWDSVNKEYQIVPTTTYDLGTTSKKYQEIMSQVNTIKKQPWWKFW